MADPPGAAGPPFVLALDVGGTKLAAARVDGYGGVHGSVVAPTRGTSAEQLWADLLALADAACAGAAPAGVGVGCGGPMRWPDGAVSPLNIPAWREFPLRDRLRERFPAVAVRVHNDAVCLAVGEHWCGAGRGAANLLGMVVSTGVGGGLVLGGRLLDGPTGNAGHIGHLVVSPDGPRCACGGTGCLEAVARGPALAQWALSHGWDPAGREVSARTVAADAAGGDPVAVAALRRSGAAVGQAVASVAALLDLDVAVVGGGLAGAGELLLGPLRDALHRHARLAFAARCRVVLAGPHAGLVGAAALVWAGERYWSAD